MTKPARYRREDLSIDQRPALRTAAARLGLFQRMTIGWSGGSEPGVEVSPADRHLGGVRETASLGRW